MKTKSLVIRIYFKTKPLVFEPKTTYESFRNRPVSKTSLALSKMAPDFTRSPWFHASLKDVLPYL